MSSFLLRDFSVVTMRCRWLPTPLACFALQIYSVYVRTSQETHYVFATEPNRLMLFGETVAVYCENHTEHTDTVRTSQELKSPLQGPTG
jgi:hypothetical protein